MVVDLSKLEYSIIDSMEHSQKSANAYALIIDRFMFDYLAAVPNGV